MFFLSILNIYIEVDDINTASDENKEEELSPLDTKEKVENNTHSSFKKHDERFKHDLDK